MWHIRTQTLIASPTSSGCIQRSSIRTVIDRELESDGKKLIHDHSWAIVIQLASCSYQVHPPTRHHIRHCTNKSPIKMQTFWCIRNEPGASQGFGIRVKEDRTVQAWTNTVYPRLVWSQSEGGISEFTVNCKLYFATKICDTQPPAAAGMGLTKEPSLAMTTSSVRHESKNQSHFNVYVNVFIWTELFCWFGSTTVLAKNSRRVFPPKHRLIS